MAPNKDRCPDCGGRMIQGFMLDVTHGGRLVARWIEGKPAKSFWTGIKVKGLDCREIESWRCDQCGLLRNYASKKVGPTGPLGL